MKVNEIILEGTRVRIEPLTTEHFSVLWDDSISEEVWRYLPSRFINEDDIIQIYSESLKAKEMGLEYPFAVYDKQLEKYVGSTRFLNISLENKNLEIGWTWYIPRVWRSRVNTECKYLLMRYCFEELALLRVQFKADTRNTRSNLALERIGAVREGTLRRDRIMQDGFIRNAHIYSIIREEWVEIKRRFETVLLK